MYDTPMDQVSVSPDKLYLSSSPAKAEKFVFSTKFSLYGHGFIQILFVVSGSGKLCLDGMEHQIRQGSIAILEDGASLDILPHSPVILYSCSFIPELFGIKCDVCSMNALKGEPSLAFFFENDTGTRLIPRISRIRIETFQKLFNDMIVETEAQSIANKHIMRLWVTELLIRIAETFCSDKSTDDNVSDSQLVQLITNYIKNNYSAKHTYDSLARMACVSRSKLFSAFKKVTGNTIGKYIEAVRLDRACNLLADSDATVLDIMLETGYNDMKMFCKRFKDYVNMTPTEYRRQHKGEE